MYKIPAEQLRQLIPNAGGCFATRRITVEGRKIGYMYREGPTFNEDSGWRFFVGDEDAAYIDDPVNTEIYSVNTIANYDPAIIPYLDAEPGSAYERDPETLKFRRTTGPANWEEGRGTP